MVAHPGHLLVAYQSVCSLQEAGLLRSFETGFYFKEAAFPRHLPARVLRELRRRTHSGLDEKKVNLHPAAELLHLFFARNAFLKRWSARMLRLRNELFDAQMGRLVEKRKPAAFIGYDSSSLLTFRRARRTDTLCILDQVVGHIASGNKILAKEKVLHPEFADTLPDLEDEWISNRCHEEALLADRVLAPSEYVRGTLVENGISPSKIYICPYGVDTARFFPKAREEVRPFRILFVGQLSQRKGIKYLLEAFKGLALENAELVLMGRVAGSGRGLQAYSGLFRHVAHVPYSELPQYYQSADIFVYPSLHEGSALAIYEALASGLPVITTHNSGSVVRDGVEGFIVPVRNVGALKEKMLLLYLDKELRQRMGGQARMRAEEYTWESYQRRLSKLMHHFISEKKS